MFTKRSAFAFTLFVAFVAVASSVTAFVFFFSGNSSDAVAFSIMAGTFGFLTTQGARVMATFSKGARR